MIWFGNLDDLKILCKSCNKQLVLESMFNGHRGIYSCPKCDNHAMIDLFDKNCEGGKGREGYGRKNG